jgi:hypothetical protein
MDFAIYLLVLLLSSGPLIVAILILILLRKSKPRKAYGVVSVTYRGEEVKSIGEKRIADYFERHRIKYEYERAARGKFLFFDFKIRAFNPPDFYLPDYNVYVEYWGLVNAEDYWTRTNYVRNMKRKMAIYYRNNIKFISIYPDNLDNLDWIFRSKFRKVTGYELPIPRSYA